MRLRHAVLSQPHLSPELDGLRCPSASLLSRLLESLEIEALALCSDCASHGILAILGLDQRGDADGNRDVTALATAFPYAF